MPEPFVVKAGEDKPAEPVSCAPAAEAASSGPDQPSGTAEPQKETYRTAELLKHWPAVLLAVQKGRQAYSSVKQSAHIIGWSLDLTQKAVGSVFSFAEDKVSRLRPVIQYADKAVSEGVVAIEKKFPIVRESPEKLYDAITQQISIVRPALDKTASISEIGRKKLNRVSKKMAKTYNRLIRRVDSWLDTLEKRLNGAESVVPGEANTGAEPESVRAVAEAPPAGRVRQAARLCWRAVSAVSAFQVGAACWLLANMPIVGRLFAEDAHPQPSMTSSSSSSSSSSDVSSSRLSQPAAAEEPALSRPLSMHTEPFLPEPPQTTT